MATALGDTTIIQETLQNTLTYKPTVSTQQATQGIWNTHQTAIVPNTATQGLSSQSIGEYFTAGANALLLAVVIETLGEQILGKSELPKWNGLDTRNTLVMLSVILVVVGHCLGSKW